MTRLTAMLVAAGLTTGCATNWDTISSRRFRENPFATMFDSSDPLHVLRTNPNSDDRARAMSRIKEPLANERGEEEQNEIMEILTQAATTDPSPWVRICAIDALGRFEDPRATEVLVQAFQLADGRPNSSQLENDNTIQTAGHNHRLDRAQPPKSMLTGPQGFPSDQSAGIRVRVLDALGNSKKPEATTLLSRVALQEYRLPHDTFSNDIVRHAAIRNLAQSHQPEALNTLVQVMAREEGKDIAIVQLAHSSLVEMTGKKLPPISSEWQAVIQAGGLKVPDQE